MQSPRLSWCSVNVQPSQYQLCRLLCFHTSILSWRTADSPLSVFDPTWLTTWHANQQGDAAPLPIFIDKILVCRVITLKPTQCLTPADFILLPLFSASKVMKEAFCTILKPRGLSSVSLFLQIIMNAGHIITTFHLPTMLPAPLHFFPPTITISSPILTPPLRLLRTEAASFVFTALKSGVAVWSELRCRSCSIHVRVRFHTCVCTRVWSVRVFKMLIDRKGAV